MIKIARITPIFYPDTISDSLYNITKLQSFFGHKLTVICWNKSNKTVYEKINKNYKIIRLKGVNFALKPLVHASAYPYIPNLNRLIKNNDFDLIHAHSHLFLTTYSAVKTAHSLGIPSIVTIHGVMAKRDFFTNILQYGYLYTIAKKIFDYSSKIICLTRSDSMQIMKLGCPSDKICLIPNSVDTDFYKPDKYSLNNELIIWTGRMVPEKGLNYLIEAAIQILKDHKNIKFILVGSGPLKNELKKEISSKNLDGNISVIGPVNSVKIKKLLGKASIFVFPSVKEGMPKSVLEAMSMGKAIVASDIPGVNDLITDNYNGFLVPPKNSVILGEKIETLLMDSELKKRFGNNARKTVVTNFSYKSFLHQLDDLYMSVIKNC